MVWSRKASLCKQCTTEATYLFLATLVESAILVLHLLIYPREDELQGYEVPRFVITISYIPLVCWTLSAAVGCQIQSYSFHEWGVHYHLVDALVWMKALVDVMAVTYWWLARNMVWHVRHLGKHKH